MAAANNSRVSGLMLELHVPDFQAAKEFYAILGFQQVYSEENYLVLARGAEKICFYGGSAAVTEHSYFSQYPAETKRGYGVEIIIPVDDLAATFAALSVRYQIKAQVQLRPWGAKDFRVEDPSGFYVRVTEAY